MTIDKFFELSLKDLEDYIRETKGDMSEIRLCRDINVKKKHRSPAYLVNFIQYKYSVSILYIEIKVSSVGMHYENVSVGFGERGKILLLNLFRQSSIPMHKLDMNKTLGEYVKEGLISYCRVFDNF